MSRGPREIARRIRQAKEGVGKLIGDVERRVSDQNADLGGNRSRPVRTPDDVRADLDALVGLDSVKEQVTTLIALLSVQQQRRDHGLSQMETSHHLVFTGNPGTGKTTVTGELIARLVGAGQRVAVSSNTNEAICNLLRRAQLCLQDRSLRSCKRGRSSWTCGEACA